MADVPCTEPHTSYDPTAEEFVCPKCKAKAGDFAIDDSGGAEGCEKLHVSDALLCYSCGFRISGQDWLSLFMAEKNLVPCPHCLGKGVVPAEPTPEKP